MPGQLISVQAAHGLLSHVRPGTHQLHGSHLLAQPRFSAWPGSIELTAVLWQPRLPDPACIARTFLLSSSHVKVVVRTWTACLQNCSTVTEPVRSWSCQAARVPPGAQGAGC